MEVISIDGVEYVKASQLAKRFKYTTDYIGQLCRAGKVMAKLVGRTWYVNLESISEHKNNRYVKSGEDENSLNTGPNNKISPKRVEAVEKKFNFKRIDYQIDSRQNFLNHIIWKPAKYEADSADLYPNIAVIKKPERIKVDLAEAKEVKISGHEKISDFKSEALPEVSLAGKIKVTNFTDNTRNNDENIARTELFREEDNSLREKSYDEAKFEINKTVTQNTKKQPKGGVKNTKRDPYSYAVEIQSGESVFASLSSRPFIKAKSKALISNTPPKNLFKPSRLDETAEKEPATGVSWFLLVFVFFGICLILATVFLEKNIFASSSDYSTSFTLNFFGENLTK